MSSPQSAKQDSLTGELVSQLDHPVTISYKGEAMVLAPKAKITNVVKSALGAIPKGVTFIIPFR